MIQYYKQLRIVISRNFNRNYQSLKQSFIEIKQLNIKVMQKTISPIVKWAQRKDNVFLTVEVRDLKDEKVELTTSSLKFSASAEGVNYVFEINFFADVVVEESKWTNYGLNVRFILSKKDKTASYWTRLIKEPHKLQYLQVDWTKYIDEDDEAEEGGKGLDDWDQNKFQNFDQGGADEDDEEAEEEQPKEGNVDDLENEEEVQKNDQAPQEGEQEKQAESN
ncbi:unnamed protein product (macronuclear) [Paramecium tetraurelia]|uniref:CS domain-containing protein n=1 Tax=Paramecium tetraurelia TaxID=5888 RepID=A0BPI1_PARTE|nr:uncharacterized protein GSPATT00005197001 [Paramecium tetraurelia]CAK60448.1 unnamed protein product [Paramecium tetraurelia]|eukprot:XP_001427846.1 hypothetical protein (macronuclear) [Paramecium tetraurelia strain d4-2]